MKKALAAIRRNGVEVATLFDQNHVDNHKNSMVGQNVLMELQQGDRIQIYLYTFTGLHDKAGNHLTQFMGLLLKYELYYVFTFLSVYPGPWTPSQRHPS